MNTFGTDIGLQVSLDLMGIAHPRPESVAFARVVAQTHQDTLSRSALFLADEDMVDLLDAAASSMPDQHLHETDIIVPDGYVYFAKPLPDRSGNPPEVPIHAMSWAFIPSSSPLLTERQASDSILITSYVVAQELAEANNLMRPGDSMPPGVPKYLPNATVMWTIGSLIGEVFGQEPPTTGYTPGFFQRVMAAFWTLSQQPKLTASTEEPTGNPTDQRRNRRAGVLNPNDPVHVIRLHRRPAGEITETLTDEESTGRKVKVRFPIRPHWRRQWYASIQQHRHILIPSHWRGPEDGPVVGGERVFLATSPEVDPGQE